MNSNLLKRLGFISLLAVLGVILQGSVLHYISPGMIVPNILLMVVVYIGFQDVSPSGALSAFLIGLISDLCSGVLVGPAAGAYVLVYGILAALSARIFVESAVTAMVVVFFSTIGANLLYVFMVYQFAPTVSRGFAAFTLEALLTAIFAPTVFKILKGLLGTSEKKSPHLKRRSRTRFAVP